MACTHEIERKESDKWWQSPRRAAFESTSRSQTLPYFYATGCRRGTRNPVFPFWAAACNPRAASTRAAEQHTPDQPCCLQRSSPGYKSVMQRSVAAGAPNRAQRHRRDGHGRLHMHP
eukprot:145342-Chlamydomonas_euryale.AAC.1